MNPDVKLPGSTDIMSESDKKTPIVPSDQGATSMTATVIPKELESEWLQFLTQKEQDKEHHEMEVYYNTLVENMQKEMGLDKQDFGPPPNLDQMRHYSALGNRSCSFCGSNRQVIQPSTSVLKRIGYHIQGIQERMGTLAEYLGSLQDTSVPVQTIEDTKDKEEKDISAEMKNSPVKG